MTDMPKGQALLGQRALVLGIANEHSIAYGCAKVFRTLGAELAITYLNEKAKPYVEPLARDLGAALVAPCDVGKEGELEAVFDRIAETWGGLDIALHSIAFALKEDLQDRAGIRMNAIEGGVGAGRTWKGNPGFQL